MKKLFATIAAAATISLAAVMLTGGAGASFASGNGQGADVAALHTLQASFHHAVSGGGHIDELMALWAPDATFTVGGGTIVLSGQDEIRDFFLTRAGSFRPTATHWVSLSPSWKTQIDVHGNTAHLYFECHFVNLDTGTLVAPLAGGTFDGTAERVHGEWLFKDVVAGNTPLTPAP